MRISVTTAVLCLCAGCGLVNLGMQDAGAEGGALDAGVLDSGPGDAGEDAGSPDSGIQTITDAGPTDAGLSDAGPTDAGLSDAGADAGPTDAGPSDGGIHLPDCDAGTVDESAALCMASPNCAPGVGQCQDEAETCQSGSWVVSQQEIGPTSEVCNGLDDDCDGYTDNERGVFVSYSLLGSCDSLCVSWNNALSVGTPDTRDTVLNPASYHVTFLQSLTQTWTPTTDGVLSQFIWLTPVTFDSGSGPSSVTVTLTDTTTGTTLWTESGISLPASFGGVGSGLVFPTTGGFHVEVVTTDVYAFTINMSASGLQSAEVQVDTGPSVSPPVGGIGSLVGNLSAGSFNFAFETYFGAENMDVCEPGVGQCKVGSEACTTSGWGSCLGEVGPTSEVCNNLDDDCDGYTDNNPGFASDTLTVSCDPLCQSWNSTYASPTQDVHCIQSASPTLTHPTAVGSFGQIFTTQENGALTSMVLDMSNPFPGSQSSIDIELSKLGGPTPVVVWATNHVTIPSTSWTWSNSSFTINFSPPIVVTSSTQYELTFTFPQIATGFTQATAPASGSSCNGGEFLINGANTGQVVQYQTYVADQTGSVPDQCQANTGQCVNGSMACTTGELDSCDHEIGPSSETCNNLDDDCDGYTDNAPGHLANNTLARSCGDPACAAWNASGSGFSNGDVCVENVGQCRDSQVTCTAGTWGAACAAEIGPSAEACNNLDDDCDGYTDNSTNPYIAQSNTLSVACSPLCSSWNRTYASPVSDASWAGPGTPVAESNVTSFGQSFTLGNSGLLLSFTFTDAAALSIAAPYYFVEVTRTSDGALVATEASSVLTSWSTLPITFTTPAPVTAGTQYILTIYPSISTPYSPATIGAFTPRLRSGYAAGNAYANRIAMSTNDFPFTTTVLPSTITAVPNPCSPGVGQCVSGARLCSSGLEGPCMGETGPSAETCNGLDDDCDGYTDNVPGTFVSYSLPSCPP